MHDPQLTHHIQLKILRSMLTKPEMRYSELKPRAVEANLFMYHLKQLIKHGLIEKLDKNYVLTRQGKHFADRATLDTMKIRVQPKLITVLAIRRSDGYWLLLKRKHQPFLNYKGFPSGKMHFGETLTESASRELYEKSGLRGVDLMLRGNMIMRFMDGKAVVNHIIGYVFYGEVKVGTTVDFKREHFESYFGPEADFFVEPCFKGHQQILQYLQQQNEPVFFYETEYESDY